MTTSDRQRSRRRAAIDAYVGLLSGSRTQPGELLELRSRLRDGRMACRFYSAAAPAGLIEAIESLGQRTDVYVGCALRARRSGGRDAVLRSWVLWAECDLPAARFSLATFPVVPTLVVASGSPHGRHAYWSLAEPVTADALEDANRRLAAALEADKACVDAARILRPPGTQNFKRTLPADVTITDYRPDRRHHLGELLSWLPALPDPEPLGAASARRARGGDPLLSLAPDIYLPALLGRPIGGDRKLTCPFHEDRTPSLHAYADHWYCFGCGAGGTLYDLAGRLWNLTTRGADFLELRRRLQHRFADVLVGVPPSTASVGGPRSSGGQQP